MSELTERQQEVLNILRNFIEENGYSPTLNELSSILGTGSPRRLQPHLIALEKVGIIKIGETCRGIRIL